MFHGGVKKSLFQKDQEKYLKYIFGKIWDPLFKKSCGEC